MADMIGLGERIKLAADRVGGLNNLVTLLTDVSRRTLTEWANDKTEPRATSLAEIARITDVSVNWLVNGGTSTLDKNLDRVLDEEALAAEATGADASRVEPAPSISDLEQPGMIAIPRYDEVRPSAGAGAAVADERLSTRVAFEHRWLTEIGVQASSAVILPAQGDSMEPTIRNGSPMLVDTSKTEVKSGNIYVIAVGDDLLVKRVHRRLDGMIELISDNSTYAPETLAPDRLSQLRVIGRVYAAVSKF